MSDEGTRAELARLRAQHRQVSDLLALIQELTSRAVRSESAADLFSRAFPTLFRCIPFDLGMAVMLEQNLDLYVTTREDASSLLNDELMARTRRTLEDLIPVSFAGTEVVVKSESHDLPPCVTPCDALPHEAFADLDGRRVRVGGVAGIGR